MNPKFPAIRVLGQRSIPSTFICRSSINRSTDSIEDAKIKPSNKDSPVSLSDFLNRKLHKSSVLPNSFQGKEEPFLSPFGSESANDSIDRGIGVTKNEETEVVEAFDVAFKQLMPSIAKKRENVSPSVDCDIGGSSTDAIRESTKRRRPFQGAGELQSNHKLLVVLGDNSNPKQEGNKKSFISNKKPRPHFNHYANGGGWWDCNMEGVDNDEVGCNEVWEGVGSTTLGGLDWH